MAKLFEYAIIHNPKKTKDARGNDTTPPSTVIVPITSVLAEDVSEVNIKASRAIPDSFLDKLAEVTIAVRPF